MLGVHCGFTENEIDEFSFVFYKDCIGELAIKFNYGAISHILANPYAGEEGQRMVQESNPFNISLENKSKKKKKLTINDIKGSGLI